MTAHDMITAWTMILEQGEYVNMGPASYYGQPDTREVRCSIWGRNATSEKMEFRAIDASPLRAFEKALAQYISAYPFAHRWFECLHSEISG